MSALAPIPHGPAASEIMVLAPLSLARAVRAGAPPTKQYAFEGSA